MEYILKHKDDNVAILDIDTEEGKVLSLETLCKELLPICAQGKVLNNATAVQLWWDNRAVSKDQSNIKDILRKYGIRSTRKLLLDNLGLSLTDCYWVCPKSIALKWKEVNLFQNAFKSDLPLQFYEHHSGLTERISQALKIGSFSPAASTGGQLEKHWERVNGKIVLLKANMIGNSFQQSLNEVFASTLHKLQGFDNHVTYHLAKLGKHGTGCECESFTSEDIEFIPAWELFSKYKKPNNKSGYDHYIDAMVKEGIEREVAQRFLDYQTVTDFLMTNIDRHLNNFGILRSSSTLKAIAPSPIFDTGNSMLYTAYLLSSTTDLLSIAIKSICSDEMSMMSHVKNLDVVNLSLLPDHKMITTFYSQDETISFNLERIANTLEYKANIVRLLSMGLSASTIIKGIRSLTEKDETLFSSSVFNKKVQEEGIEKIAKLIREIDPPTIMRRKPYRER